MGDDDLRLAPGLPGSGRRRYAAAMARWARGEMTPEALEAYRVLSARDGDDPAALLGPLGGPEAGPSGAAAAGPLRAELRALLHRLRGPGVAEARRPLAADAPGAAPARAEAADRWLFPALAALGSEPALARALAEAGPGLGWAQREGAGQAWALVGAGPDGTASLLVLAPGSAAGLAGPELWLPLMGPHALRLGASETPRPALRPVWVAPGREGAVRAGGGPLLALVVRFGAAGGGA